MPASEEGTAARLNALLRAPALALTLAALFWSGNFIAGRALRGQIDPVTLNFTRWLVALALFMPFVWRDLRDSLPVIRREWRLILGLGATGIAAFHTLTYLALQTTTAANALMILSLVPIALLLTAGRHAIASMHPRRHIGVMVSLLGAKILLAPGIALRVATGDLWMFAAVGIWTWYTLLLRRRPPDLPQHVALAASIWVALLLMLPVVLLMPGTDLAAFASLPALLGIGYIAVFASVIAFLFWSHGVAQLGPSRAGQFIQLMPVFGVLLAVTLLGETLTWIQIAGAALVLAGIALVEWPSGAKPERGAP